ncbi:hypothetical protein EZV62_010629 [Acer yangbiense]|uniref:Uncharacterized protein n=1 Tax=Acer yangbiense TaxID=1000413 RepID=A0A5C7I3E2_9ROSI|nr:hypothetical protein EZV62_010629 [Acer yangbiense]
MKTQINEDGDAIINDSPIEQVRLTVPITDDPTLPTLTFRTWVLGPITCAILAFVSQFFLYRQNTIRIPSTCVQMLLIALGKLMAATLPSKPVKVPGTRWSFSMNPGPFNIKENVLLTILATSGSDSPYAVTILSVKKIYYKKYLNFWAGLLMVLTTQLLGYGFAGIFMKFLVYNPYMWYPFTLLDVSFYRSLHEVEVRPTRGISKFQFFLITVTASFAYAVVPGYFFPSIGALSIVCLFWKNSVTAQLIGSGLSGFGIGSFSFDWNVISSYLGNPLGFPMSTIINNAIGFILLLYIICPIAYLTNSNNARHFPFSSLELFDKSGHLYDVSKVLNHSDLTFNKKGYENYSHLYMSVVYLFLIGFDFASITATLSHFVAFHARDVWRQFKQAYCNKNASIEDIHNRLMKKYDLVPQWWFFAIVVLGIFMGILSCEGFGNQMQLPYWGILPIANLVFKALTISTQSHALSFFSEFKLAHYMKIAPRSMFVAQVTGTIISSIVSVAASWWLLSAVENICVPEKLPKGSPWTCPGMTVTYDNSVIWGVVGPMRIYYPDGVYSKLLYFFLIGGIAPLLVWALSKYFPEKKWIKSINIPNILGGASVLLIAGAVNYWSWITVGVLFNVIIYNKYKDWWTKYNYVLANGLDLGVAFQSLLTSATLQINDIYGVNWWGLDVGDHCPLAQCPTAPGVSVEDDDEIINDSPIEQVRLTIPVRDDPTLPTLTFRTWVLGPITCFILAFLTQFFMYRQNYIDIPSSVVQMVLVFFGKLMAAKLPSEPVKVPGTTWSFSMNPGPFNIKKHVLLSILANSGSDSPYSILIMVVRKIFYKKYLNFLIGLLMALAIQVLGYGFAGIFMKFLVYNPYMWYPLTLLDVSFYSALSVVCWFWKHSVIAQLIGSGRNGFGIGSFTFDWSATSGYIGNPIAYPVVHNR